VQKWTALISASGGGHIEVVRLLLDAGANLNATDNNVCKYCECVPSVKCVINLHVINWTIMAIGSLLPPELTCDMILDTY
jgi:hypothetical protein